MKKQSFSVKVKEELAKIENKKPCCKKAQAYAFLFFGGYFENESEVFSEFTDIVRNVAQELNLINGIACDVSQNKNKASLSFTGKGNKLLLTAYFEQLGNYINSKHLKNSCCKKAFLRELFFASGYVSDPNSSYKLEFSFNQISTAEFCFKFINELEIVNLKQSVRANKIILYTKTASQIEDFIAYMGAVNSAMDFMQVKMYKEAVNDINRKSNFETANIDKTYTASAKQTVAITTLMKTDEYAKLPKDLQQLARLRMDNIDMTLTEMAKILCISRSAVNHRLNKIIKLADNSGKRKEK